MSAALRRFHVSGFKACTIEDIADEAAVFKGSFYNHFKSKEALAIAAVQRYAEAGISSLELDGSSSPLKRLRNHFEHIAAWQSKNHRFQGCLLANFSAEMSDTNRDLRIAVNEFVKKWSLAIAQVLSQAQTVGEIGKHHDVHRLARFLLNAWEGATIRMRNLKSQSPLEDFFKVAFEVVLT